MRFRKRPKVVEAIQVRDIISGATWPFWLIESMNAGKCTVEQDAVGVIISGKIKRAWMNDWIAYDSYQQMIYAVSQRTMASDYEAVPDDATSGHGHG